MIAGSVDLTGDAAAVFSGWCYAWWVRNRADSAGLALIQVTGLHGDEWIPLAPGVELAFDLQEGITAVSAKAASLDGGAATATIDCGPMAGRVGR